MDSYALGQRIRPLLEEFVRDNYPGCELGAFILNVFATGGSDDIFQDVIAEGHSAKLSEMEAAGLALQSIQQHLKQNEFASGPTGGTPKPMARA